MLPDSPKYRRNLGAPGPHHPTRRRDEERKPATHPWGTGFPTSAVIPPKGRWGLRDREGSASADPNRFGVPRLAPGTGQAITDAKLGGSPHRDGLNQALEDRSLATPEHGSGKRDVP